MSKLDLSSVAGIRAEIVSIGKAGKALDSRIQACAIACLKHMIEHRDHTLLVELYKGLSAGQRRASMAAWIMAFSQLDANTDATSKKDTPFVLNKAKKLDLEGAIAMAWYDAGKAEQEPDAIFDAQKAFKSFLARAMKADTMKGATRESMVQAAALFGIPESDVPTKAVKPAATV